MKKKLFVLGVLLAIGTNVNFVEAAGALTHTTAVEFKDESTSYSRFTDLTHLSSTGGFDKRGVTKIDGSVIQLHSTNPSNERDQLTSLTGKQLRFSHSGDFLSNFDIDGMYVMGFHKGITAVSGNIELYGYPQDDEAQPQRYMQFSIDNVTMGDQQIHGVHAGEADTDAVNVSQLKELRSQVDINTNDITDLKNKLGNTNTLSEAKHYTD